MCRISKEKFKDYGHQSYHKSSSISYTCKYRGLAYSACNLKTNPQKNTCNM